MNQLWVIEFMIRRGWRFCGYHNRKAIFVRLSIVLWVEESRYTIWFDGNHQQTPMVINV